MISKAHLPLFRLLAVTFMCFHCSIGEAQENSSSPIVTVNVNLAYTPSKAKSMAGFLSGIGYSAPPDSLIKDLKPALWRLGDSFWGVFPRIKKLNATPILVLSDLYHYPDSKGWENPSNNMTSWVKFIDSVYRKASSISDKIIYDIWNEPNIKRFWNGTREQYFQLFKVAHDRIRSMPGGESALIAGPSISWFDRSFLNQFLDYCLANSIKLDVLTWHDFRSGWKIPHLKDDLLRIRNDVVNNSRYAPLKIRYIQINEINNSAPTPASILSYMDALEKGKADGSCKSCWAEENSKLSQCYNNSIDGLLSPSLQKRPAWWTYYYYAQTTENRYPTEILDTSVVCFAARVPGQNQLIIVGGFLGSPSQPNAKTIRCNLSHISSSSVLRGKKQVSVTLFKIPSSGSSVLLQPMALASYTIPITNNNLDISVPQIGSDDVFAIKIN